MTGPRYSALLIIGVIVQSPISLPVSLEAQTIARAVAGGSGHDLVQLLNAGTGAAKTIYTSSTWRTTNISISPAGTYIAFLEVDLGSLNGPRRWIKNTLVVLDTAGVVVRRIAGDVQRYGWCGSSCVACVTGVTDETDLHFQPTGALVVDVSTGSIKTWPIASWPYLFEYAVFDSSLYVAYGAPPNGDLVIARYDARRNEVVPTSHKGLAFSFDGRFYLSQPRRRLARCAHEMVAKRWQPPSGSQGCSHQEADRSAVDLSSGCAASFTQFARP